MCLMNNFLNDIIYIDRYNFSNGNFFRYMNPAPVSQRSWVQILYVPQFFYRSYFKLLVSVVFLAARISE